MDWSTQRIVVTGAGSGIGAAVARQLLDKGAAVVAVDLNGEGMQPLADRGATVVATSVATDEGRAKIVEAAGELTGLVNAAGLMITEPISETTPDTWDRIMDVNGKGVFFLCRDLIPKMADGKGAVVNLSSVAAKFSATSEAAIYSASKAAVQCITRTFAHVHAKRGIRVNTVCPGVIDTPMQDFVMEKAAAARGMTTEQLRDGRRQTLIPMQREGSADECATSIIALLSDDWGYVTGQTINVDGGFQMY